MPLNTTPTPFLRTPEAIVWFTYTATPTATVTPTPVPEPGPR
jgi:hypothetical protein